MRRILIATDGSVVSAEAVRAFARLLGPGFAHLYVLAVLPEAPARDAAAPARFDREAEAAQDALDLALIDLGPLADGAVALTRAGDPAAAIVAVAREVEADLVVLGTHGRQGLDRLLNGSVAERVLRDAPCTVMVHPHGARVRQGV